MGYKLNYSVYKITNIENNKCYIGVDSYFPKRIRQHQSRLLNNKHKNKHLQFSYNKYGKDRFTFELLCSCLSREEMLSKEIELIKFYNSLENGYNHTIGGEGSYGYVHSKESISKMSSWKRVITDEWKKSISKATKGKKKKEGIKRINHPNYSQWLGGEKHPVAKFTWEMINNLRNDYKKGITQKQLSINYGLAYTYVNSILHNRFWKDNNYKFIKYEKEI